jgi:TatD DNase family protein
MLIDTHCHLDALEFSSDRLAVIERARAAGLAAIVIPSVARSNFDKVRDLAHSFEMGAYALGIHPMCVPRASDDDLLALESRIKAAIDDPRFVAIGEIGLDFFIPELKEPEIRIKQERFYTAQLDLALRYELPVLLHVRRSQDMLLKHLRRRSRIGGIAHAFNGSFQQADEFLKQGFAFGFGGAMTFTRALQIRRLAAQLPLDSLVLETDAPDIAPAWLEGPLAPPPGRSVDNEQAARRLPARNEPAEVAGIGNALSGLRQMPRAAIAAATTKNAQRIMPRLARLLSLPKRFA